MSEGWRTFQKVGRNLSFAAAGLGKTGPEKDPVHFSVLVTNGSAAVEKQEREPEQSKEVE